MENSIKDQLQTVKAELAEAKSNLRKFKVANKIKDVEAISDPDLKAEYDQLEAKVNELSSEKEGIISQLKSTNKGGKGGEKYSYQMVIDPVTGESRAMTKEEKKKWRNHARKEAKKLGLGDPSEVPMDPNFFIKPKKEKKEKKEKAEKVEKPEKAEKPEKKVKKVKREISPEDDD